MIGERIQHVDRIKGLLAIHGIYDYHPLRRDRMQQLEQLRSADGRTSPPRLKAETLRELQRLELVVGMIKAIEVERDERSSPLLGRAERSTPKARRIVAEARAELQSTFIASRWLLLVLLSLAGL